MKTDFWSTVVGSWLKAFLSAILTFVLLQYSNGLTLTDISLWSYLGAGLGALLPAILKWVNSTDGWMNTFFGSLVKNILSITLSLVIAWLGDGNSLFDINLTNLFNSMIPALLPSILNWLNPNDPRYGKVKG